MADQQQLNWSYFKPEFVGKPEKDAEAHLFRTNDWMDTHNFSDDQKVRRFCVTLTGEVRLWYETIRQVQLDWPVMQEHLDSNIQSLVTLENSIFIFGDLFNMMKLQTP